MKEIEKHIDDVRERLNLLVSSKDIELTDNVVVSLSKQLDELLNEYARHTNSG